MYTGSSTMEPYRDPESAHVIIAPEPPLSDYWVRLKGRIPADVLIEYVDLFLGTLTDYLFQLNIAVEIDDAPMLASAAESLKSSSATIGAIALARLSATLEAQASEGQWDDALTTLGLVRAEAKRVRLALADEFPE
jgi:HPt (histidine-containing phosphotransfer) domain-containing protein